MTARTTSHRLTAAQMALLQTVALGHILRPEMDSAGKVTAYHFGETRFSVRAMTLLRAWGYVAGIGYSPTITPLGRKGLRAEITRQERAPRPAKPAPPVQRRRGRHDRPDAPLSVLLRSGWLPMPADRPPSPQDYAADPARHEVAAGLAVLMAIYNRAPLAIASAFPHDLDGQARADLDKGIGSLANMLANYNRGPRTPADLRWLQRMIAWRVGPDYVPGLVSEGQDAGGASLLSSPAAPTAAASYKDSSGPLQPH